MLTLEICATICGLLQSILVLFNKRSNWIFYTLQMICLIGFSYLNHLYGDVANNSIYLMMGIAGWILWKKDETSQGITRCNRKERLFYICFMALGTALLCVILSDTQDPLPWTDAFTTTSSLTATYYMVRRKIDTWVIWFINDIFYAIEYAILPNPAFYLMALNIFWIFMAVASFIHWRRLMKGEK